MNFLDAQNYIFAHLWYLAIIEKVLHDEHVLLECVVGTGIAETNAVDAQDLC